MGNDPKRKFRFGDIIRKLNSSDGATEHSSADASRPAARPIPLGEPPLQVPPRMAPRVPDDAPMAEAPRIVIPPFVHERTPKPLSSVRETAPAIPPVAVEPVAISASHPHREKLKIDEVESYRQPEESEFDLFKYIAILFRRKNIIILAVLIMAVVGLMSFLKRDKYYTATARMLFKPGHSEIVENQSVYVYYEDRAQILQTHLEMMKSDEVSRRLAHNLENPPSIGTITSTQGEANGSKNDIIEITCRHSDPVLARDVANEMCHTYIVYNKEVYTQDLDRLLVKMETQLAKVQVELKEKEDALRTFKETNRMVELSADVNIVVSKLTNMELALQQTNLALLESRERLSSSKSEINQQDINVVQSMTYNNPYQARLNEKELELNTLLSQNSPTHYKVKMVQEEIDQLKLTLRKDVEKEATSRTFVKNPIRESLRQSLINNTIDISALDAKRAAQELLIKQLNAELLTLPSIEQQFAYLQRQTESLLQVHKMIKERYEEGKIKRDSQESDLKILELAQLPAAAQSSVSSTDFFRKLLIGLIIGIVLAFLLEYFDQRIKDPSDVEKHLEVPLLGIVPLIDKEKALIEARSGAGKSLLEPFRTLRANLKHLAIQHKASIFMLCSAVKGEGKTTLATNLAITFAMDGKRVILVDADLRRSQVHTMFGVSKTMGLADYLQASADLNDIIKPSGYENLSIVTSGERPPNPAELVGTIRFDTLVQELRGKADIVIFDSPAILPVSDTLTMASKMDACLFVVRNFWTPGKAAAQAKEQLRRVNATIWGGIINGIPRSRGYYPYYYGYYRYYAYKYTYEDDTPENKPSLRLVGLAIEKKAKEALQSIAASLPQYRAAFGVFTMRLMRKKRFWLLSVLLAALIMANGYVQHKNKTQASFGIEYLGTDLKKKKAEQVRPFRAVDTIPITEIAVSQGASSSLADPLFTSFADSIRVWHQALFSKDLKRYLAFYDTLDFKYPGGGYAQWYQWVLGNAATDPLFTSFVSLDSVWKDTVSGSFIPTHARCAIIAGADTTHTEFVLLWRVSTAGWRIAGQKQVRITR